MPWRLMFFMLNMVKRLFSILKCVKSDTHFWCVSVLGGAILLCISFFMEPSQRMFEVSQSDEASAYARQKVIEYSSVLGGLSTLDTKIEEDDDLDDIIAETLEERGSGFVATNEVDVDISKVYPAEAVDALERLVQCEACGEDVDGRILVANVVLNRVDTGIWGDDIISVIEAPGQFDPVENGAVKVCEVDSLTKDAVISALSGEDFSQGAIYFQKSAAKNWGDKEYLFRYGSHSFYK